MTARLDDEPTGLNMLAEKVEYLPVNPDHLAYCPTMDLIALATVNEQVHVNRLNGQRVFSVISKPPGAQVRQMKWKPNGQSLAVAFSNHSICLTDAHTGKMMHQIDCSAHSASQVCCLGWGMNFTDIKAVRKHLNELGGEVTLDDILSQSIQMNASDTLPDLPMDLAFLDAEGTLPKLSTLAVGGKEDEILNSRASLDTLFQQPKKDYTDSADVLVVGFDDGTIHLSIYDFFEIGSFNIQQSSQARSGSKALLHSSHPYSTTHTLLIAAASPGQDELHILPLDLRLVSSAGRYLSLLASKSTQLHNVLRYIHQVQRQIYTEFKTSLDLPGKFVQNIEETLKEKCDCTWVQAAYHLVVTGNCFPPVKEWLVDELGERGHKRWEKAAVTGYENVRRLTHENLMPALERFNVIVSRLRGLSRFQKSNAALGLSTQELDNILDSVNCLQFLAHRILIATCSELRQFSAFSTWLRQEIDTQAADSTSPSAQDAVEKDGLIDHARTLEYIGGAMMQSQLIGFFNMQPQLDKRLKWDLAAEGRSLYELYKRELNEFSQGTKSDKQLPGLDALIAHLDAQCNLVSGRIAETQRRNVRFGAPIYLGNWVPVCKDMRMVNEHAREINVCVTYVASVPFENREKVWIHRVILKIENGISTTMSVEYALVQLSLEKVVDVKFVDDDSLIVALSGQPHSRLLCIPYRNTAGHPGGLMYTKLALGDSTTACVPESSVCTALEAGLPDLTKIPGCAQHTFPEGVTWCAERLEINGRKGRRVACVLAQDRKHYRIYDVDSFS